MILECCVETFGGYVGTNYPWHLGALLAASEGCVEPFGGYVRTMLGSLGPCSLFFKTKLDHLEPISGLCWAVRGSAGGFGGLC